MLSLQTPVALLSADGIPQQHGKIVGYATLHTHGVRQAYLVQLDHGFFNPEKDLYVSVMVVDAENAAPL